MNIKTVEICRPPCLHRYFVLLAWIGLLGCITPFVFAAEVTTEVIQACLIPDHTTLNAQERVRIAQCLEWQSAPEESICHGHYTIPVLSHIADDDVQVEANEVTLLSSGRSVLQGRVDVRQQDKQIQANTAHLYRDSKTGEVTKIILIDEVRYLAPEGLMRAKRATYLPHSKQIQIEMVLYRLGVKRRAAELESWGRARSVWRNEKGQLFMQQATYTHCSPQDQTWELKAHSLKLEPANNVGTAKHATLHVLGLPVLYSPFLTFPLSKKRKSGFLMPVLGSSTVGGIDFTLPYYMNLAPNYDATFIPHLYTKRGLMYGGQFRYLDSQGTGTLSGNILPDDRYFSHFINENLAHDPALANQSTNRWEAQWQDHRSLFDPALRLRIDAKQVSDNYYLQDFSTSLATVTERQILREAVLQYNTAHWFLNSTVQNYQTLNPVNETPIASIYDRLPQVLARGDYDNLPLDTHLVLDGAYDYFHWSNASVPNPNASRYYFNPRVVMDKRHGWGYLSPFAQWVARADVISQATNATPSQTYLSVPRYGVDTGLTFERNVDYFHHAFLQTLEPRLYYLNVPYQNQVTSPVFDSTYMIFTAEQIFRDNRFSGFDRVGDANQLSYGVTSRWLKRATGEERALFSLAQIVYFANRKVGLCSSPTGICVENPLTLGYLSQVSKVSPVAAHGVYHLDALWSLVGDYAWDPAAAGTNNSQVEFRYHAEQNRLLTVGYTYLTNGDITQVGTSPIQDNALNQVGASYAWPFTEKWSTLGAYTYNLSKKYQMMALFGVQYDSCCWAARLLAGQTLRSFSTYTIQPEYTNSIFFQVLLKGLGSVGTSDPSAVLKQFVPGYQDRFRS